MKGLAGMKYGPKEATEAAPKSKPSGSAKTQALREVIAALKDGDEEGAAEALGTAVRACMTDYEDEEED